MVINLVLNCIKPGLNYINAVLKCTKSWLNGNKKAEMVLNWYQISAYFCPTHPVSSLLCLAPTEHLFRGHLFQIASMGYTNSTKP